MAIKKHIGWKTGDIGFAPESAAGGDFVIADVSSGSSIDNIALEQSGGTFAVADVVSASSIDNILLEQGVNNPPTVALNTADLMETADTTPTLNFTGTDENGNEVEYEIQIDTVNTFDSQ